MYIYLTRASLNTTVDVQLVILKRKTWFLLFINHSEWFSLVLWISFYEYFTVTTSGTSSLEDNLEHLGAPRQAWFRILSIRIILNYSIFFHIFNKNLNVSGLFSVPLEIRPNESLLYGYEPAKNAIDCCRVLLVAALWVFEDFTRVPRYKHIIRLLLFFGVKLRVKLTNDSYWFHNNVSLL